MPLREVVQVIPPDSAIAKFMQQMNNKDQETVTKLHDRPYYIALHGLPFTQFKHHIHLEKLHNASYAGVCENKSACKKFIFDISDYFFQEEIPKKMELFNFIAVLCHGSINKSITEHEVVYVIYVDPKTNLPVMKFF